MEKDEKKHVVDLRSDTISKPTAMMKEAMIKAEIGDDVYGEDPTINEFEEFAANMFGKEAALFVVSGTMGNLISVACHCDVRASEVFIGDKSHIYCYEQGGIAQLCSVVPRTLANNENGTFDLSQLKAQISRGTDPHKSITSLVAVENTFNGRVLPIDFLKQLRELTNEYNLPIHLDGARLMNAAAAMEVDVKEITQYVDSANICLSKGLCSPVGSVIVGNKNFIRKARRMRKVLGGGMRQAGILAASGLISLRQMSKRLKDDHHNAFYLAKVLQFYDPSYIKINMDLIQTNMIFFKINENISTGTELSSADEFIRRLSHPKSDSFVPVKALHMGSSMIRMVFYNGISFDDTKLAEKAIKNVFDNWEITSD